MDAIRKKMQSMKVKSHQKDRAFAELVDTNSTHIISKINGTNTFFKSKDSTFENIKQTLQQIYAATHIYIPRVNLIFKIIT